MAGPTLAVFGGGTVSQEMSTACGAREQEVREVTGEGNEEPVVEIRLG